MKRKYIKGIEWFCRPGRICLIAEAGSNHNGKLSLGKQLIEAAKECGCDAVKFQAFKAENLASETAKKAQYQKARSKGKSQLEMLKGLELSEKEHLSLISHAKKISIPLFYSVFDKESADFIDKAGVPILKLGSGELTNIPLIRHISNKNKPLILSTGMADDKEIDYAVAAFRENGNRKLFLMNCSTGYPSLLHDANLRRVRYLEKRYGLTCGNSDHTQGIIVSVIAAAIGIRFIEKHFTLNKGLAGPDHFMSMDPQEMSELCGIIRLIEKEPVPESKIREGLKETGIETTKNRMEIILGEERRHLSDTEKRERLWARKSVVAASDIKKGEAININNTALKRPEKGILPKDYEKVLGRKIKHNIRKGAPIEWGMLA